MFMRNLPFFAYKVMELFSDTVLCISNMLCHLQAFVEGIWNYETDSWRRQDYAPGRSSAVRQNVIDSAWWPANMDQVRH